MSIPDILLLVWLGIAPLLILAALLVSLTLHNFLTTRDALMRGQSMAAVNRRLRGRS